MSQNEEIGTVKGVSLGILAIGLSCLIVVSTLGVIANLAKAQVETCPYGYYLATNNVCYPYQQQQQPQGSGVTAINQELAHVCKINHDMIAVDKGLGVNQSQLLPLENLYNDTCGSVGR